MSDILIVGGGIGGLSAALACAQAGADVQLFERAAEFSEVGAGIQLGPNAMRVLHGWGLAETLAEVAAFPDRLQVRSATAGTELGTLRLGKVFEQRYGAPYATIHRADLHALLLFALYPMNQVQLNLNNKVTDFSQTDTGVTVQFGDDNQAQGDVLVGADGGASTIRQQLLADGAPKPTGHLAYRTMVRQSDLPQHLRSQQVTAWLGPRLHVVQYPVRGGDWLNVVAIIHGKVQGDMSNWDHSANVADLQNAMAATCAPLNDLIHAIPDWRLWSLSIRPPMSGAHEHGSGRVALLGDAAHPMVPYLAQGAAMAIEDANCLATVLAAVGMNARVPEALGDYAQQRWQRNARVQARAIRNGQIFHMTGPMRLARDAAMRLLGESLLDMPWLYGSDK